MKTAELFDVRGLVTIVTGAASGIGLAYAEVMADNGARVTLMDRDAASLDAAVRRLAERGGDVRGQTLDVTDRPGLRAGIDAAAAHYGRLGHQLHFISTCSIHSGHRDIQQTQIHRQLSAVMYQMIH